LVSWYWSRVGSIALGLKLGIGITPEGAHEQRASDAEDALLVMQESGTPTRSKQEVFRSMVLGILLYSVVLGFFNDYTNIFSATSYSTTFAVAVVMQLLTYATFVAKDRIVFRFKRAESTNRVGLALSVWLLMFLSKFVFLGVIDLIFSQEVEISGFLGLIAIIAALTSAQSLVELADRKLAD
jgi:hypothetical protein